MLFIVIRKNRRDKLEILYDTVIAPSNDIFFRASVYFICQKDISEEDKKRVKDLETKGSDYITLLNSAERCKVMFSKNSDFYKRLDLLCTECREQLNSGHRHIYSKDDISKIKETVLYPLHNLYKKYSRLYYIIFDYPQI